MDTTNKEKPAGLLGRLVPLKTAVGEVAESLGFAADADQAMKVANDNGPKPASLKDAGIEL